jgi:excisionase family DNA binding protein
VEPRPVPDPSSLDTEGQLLTAKSTRTQHTSSKITKEHYIEPDEKVNPVTAEILESLAVTFGSDRADSRWRWIMTELLTRDADALHRALDKGGDEIEVSVSRETAEWLARLVDAKARGQEVMLTRGNAEVTPAEAAELLGMSRPQVRKLMDEGKLAFRKVGTHHRVKVASIRAFLEAERIHMGAGMQEFSRLQNELGLLE